jgi:HSP20 family molecular chaperone IbpA
LIRLRAILHGPPINGEKPKGKAEFELENSRRKFSAEVDNVKLADGTVLVVKVSGHRVGTIKVQAEGGALLLTGKRAPSVTKGTHVGVFLGTERILSGNF